MINYLFKSDSKSDLQIINNKLEMLLAEQRHQRSDLQILLRKTQAVYNALALQKQVDEYFDEDEKETSPQTDSETK